MRSSPRFSPIQATPGTAAALGYKVITLYPDESGIPDLNALKAAVSPRDRRPADHQP